MWTSNLGTIVAGVELRSLAAPLGVVAAVEISRFDAVTHARGRQCATDAPGKKQSGGAPPTAGASSVAGASGGGDASLGAALSGTQMGQLVEVLTRLTDALRGVVSALQGLSGGGDLGATPPADPAEGGLPPVVTQPAMPAPAAAEAAQATAPAPTSATTDAADAAATVQPTDDAGLVQRVLSTLDQSETGRTIAAGLRNIDVTVSLASDQEMDTNFGANVMGYYDLGSDTIVLRRSHAVEDPKFAAYILAHEGKHAIDDASGIEDRWLDDAKRAAQAVQNPAQFLKQKTLEQTLVAEATAFSVGGMVAQELGIQPMVDDPAFGPNGLRNYDEIWQLLTQSSTYNPEGLDAPAPRTWEQGVLT